MRLQADFENYRRRMASQHAAEVDRATGRLAEALLPVLDAAEAAFIQHPEEIGPLLNACSASCASRVWRRSTSRTSRSIPSRRRRRPRAGRRRRGRGGRGPAQRLPLAGQDAASGDGAHKRPNRWCLTPRVPVGDSSPSNSEHVVSDTAVRDDREEVSDVGGAARVVREGLLPGARRRRRRLGRRTSPRPTASWRANSPRHQPG